MAHLLSDLVGYFKLDDVNIDNWTFKLYYKVSMVICMTGATVGIASQYFGDPISCEFQGINSDLAQDYCWITGSSYIPPQYQGHVKCIVDQEAIQSPEDAPDTSYYQWVTFMFAIQAAIFYLPYKVWKALEGGLLESFGAEGKTPVMISEAARYDDGVVMEAVVEKFVKYFKSIFHHNSWYFASFVMCEMLNFGLLFVQFQLTDNFLNNKFRWYGWDVVKYYSHSYKTRNNPDLNMRNPSCAVFPTITSCNIPNVGAAGGEQFHNGLCVLTQNIINEKIFLVLWFWYAFLVPVSIVYIFYRLITLLFDGVRFGLIYKTVRHKYDDNIRRCLEFILAKGQMGDWFVLYQLSKNCSSYFYREFIRELAMELKTRPKKTKSKSSSLGNSNSLKKEKALKNTLSRTKDKEGSLTKMISPEDMENGQISQSLRLQMLNQSDLSDTESDSGLGGRKLLERKSESESESEKGPRLHALPAGRPGKTKGMKKGKRGRVGQKGIHRTNLI